MTHMAQMILSKPLFIVVCMYQEMMRWFSMSSLLNGVAGQKAFLMKPKAANPTQHDPYVLDDPLKTFGHHCLDDQQLMGWLSSLLNGVVAGLWSFFGCESGCWKWHF
jgi:hypothetical protein